LGTSTREEAIEYFSDLDKHKIDFTYTGHRDDEMIELAFHKKKAAERKTWLTAYEVTILLASRKCVLMHLY
jgi:DNA topoisomerase II